MKKFIRWVCACGMATGSMTALADWDTNQAAKWVQMPDVTTNGIDVRAYDPKMLADDFLCTNSGPITDIHIWGSWRNDELPPSPGALSFQLGIWTDVPTNQSGLGYSMPGTLLWSTNVSYPGYTGRLWMTTTKGEGWYDPNTGLYVPAPADYQIWQYNFLFDRTNAFKQLGSPTNPIVYWLSVKATILGGPVTYEFGWKTSTNHWNDDGVWRDIQGGGGWNELRYPLGHPMHGESMDLAFVVTTAQDLDFGDAPDPSYPTLLANNGARHVITGAGPWLGPTNDIPDAEADGQPVPAGTGDDVSGYDDEDGVTLLTNLIPGQSNRVAIYVIGGGIVDAWIDFNADGTWQPAEQIISGYLPPGNNLVPFLVPYGAVAGTTYARFRISTAGGLGPTGLASDGEVEDHVCTITDAAYDFGDAPNPFPTLLAANGARHTTVSNVYLGFRVDAEMNGQPSGTATGDDIAPVFLADDEDGFAWPSFMIVGRSHNIPVRASVPGFLYGWIDFTGDGDWADAGEAIAGSPFSLGAGLNLINISIPASATSGGLMSRFRFVTNMIAGLSYTGWVDHGEVEDYELQIRKADFGDAPSPYPTLAINNGAFHLINGTPTLYFGATIDTEADGMPDPAAAGDDNSAVDDEDGVAPTNAVIRGSNVVFQIVLSAFGAVYAWIDFNADGDWADAGEMIFGGLPMGGGTNNVSVAIPVTANIGPTFARFRLTSTNTLSYNGMAPDGEVEDIPLTILQPRPAANVAVTNLVRSGSSLSYWWNPESNVTYQLESTTNSLVDPSINWSNLGTWVNAPTNIIIDPSITATVKFYRVVVPYVP